jgi:hypothetical protein
MINASQAEQVLRTLGIDPAEIDIPDVVRRANAIVSGIGLRGRLHDHHVREFVRRAAEQQLRAAWSPPQPRAPVEASVAIPLRLRRTPAGMDAIDLRVLGVLAAEGKTLADIDGDEYLRRFEAASVEVYPIDYAAPTEPPRADDEPPAAGDLVVEMIDHDRPWGVNAA